MTGLNRHTAKPMDGAEHIGQSIRDIITTPIGTRTMLRDYGSRVPELVDAPMHKGTQLLLIAATAGPIFKWEPRVRLTKVTFTDLSSEGRPTLKIDAVRTDLPGNPPFSLSLAL